VPALDHLLELFSRYASMDLSLEVEPGAAEEEISAAGTALGQALHSRLREQDARRYGWASMPADEALAQVVLEVSETPLLRANVDLSEAHVGGLSGDVIGRFLGRFAEGAGLTLHVRLIEGDDPQHVLEAIFKALGVALADACGPRTTRKE
jgi:imidazoleglycerol-phosphate dehydratase